MKTLKANRKKTALTIAVLAAAAAVAVAIILTSANIKHGGASKHYDLNCLTEPNQKPLTECEEK